MKFWFGKTSISILGIFILASCATKGILANSGGISKNKILMDKVMQYLGRGRVVVEVWRS